MGSTFEPPVQYLRDCSDNSLRHFEVIKLEHVANLRRELRALWDEMLEESALALLARWMIENRSHLRSSIHPVEPPLAALGEPASLPKSPKMAQAEAPEFLCPAAASLSAASPVAARGPVLVESVQRSSPARGQDFPPRIA